MVRRTFAVTATDPHAHGVPQWSSRRSVCAGLAACLLGVGPALVHAGQHTAAGPSHPNHPASPAMARLGARLVRDLPPATVADLRWLAGALHGTDAPALGARIAADFRNGRVVVLRGVALSRTEAACFIAAADVAQPGAGAQA